MIPLKKSDDSLNIGPDLGSMKENPGYINKKSWEEGPNPYVQESKTGMGNRHFKIKLDNATEPLKNK